MVWALAKMEQHVEPATLQQLLAAVVRSAHKCTAQGLCNVVWAVATLKVTPEPQWMQVRGSPMTAQALLLLLGFCTTRLGSLLRCAPFWSVPAALQQSLLVLQTMHLPVRSLLRSPCRRCWPTLSQSWRTAALRSCPTCGGR